MAWIYVIIAGILEIASVSYMNVWKHTRRKWDVVKISLAFGSSLCFLHLALHSLPMSITYAVWSGIGSAGAIIFGIVKYGEKANWKRLVFITMILGSVVGLKLVS